MEVSDRRPGHLDVSVGVDFWQWEAAKPNFRGKGPRKKPRDPLLQDDEIKRIKGKSSKSGLASKQTTAPLTAAVSNGSWRKATLRLLEDDDGVQLQILNAGSSLQTAIDLSKLPSTNLRRVDQSILANRYSIGIYHATGIGNPSNNQGSTAIYIAFPNQDALRIWMALLLTYTKPETHCLGNVQLYRIWRQVQIEVNTMNIFSMMQAGVKATSSLMDNLHDQNGSDAGMYCDIFLNDELVSRTSTQEEIRKEDIRTLSWFQVFSFSDIPHITSMRIQVCREKPFVKSRLFGSTSIPTRDIQHGEFTEGWFPLLRRGGPAGESESLQVGEIKLRYKLEEEVILPQSHYSELLRICDDHNVFDLLMDLEQRMLMKTITPHVVYVSIARQTLVEDVKRQADKEIDGSANSHNTLFRGNTVLTKAVEKAMLEYGGSWLEVSLKRPLTELCSEGVSIETDTDKSRSGIKDQVELLGEWCLRIWNSIYMARDQCPNELRAIFAHIRHLVEAEYANKPSSLHWQAVAAFLFLRFFVPAILKPHLFGLWPGLLPQTVQRSLTLVGKTIQSLANLNTKEEHMRNAKEFINSQFQKMIEYLNAVSTLPDRVNQRHAFDPHEGARNEIVNIFNIRLNDLPVLHRESIPLLPHNVDVARHLALITSGVVRNCRKLDRDALERGVKPLTDEALARLGNLIYQCLSIESEVLRQVKLGVQIGNSHNDSNMRSRGEEHLTSNYKSSQHVDHLLEAWDTMGSAGSLGANPPEADTRKRIWLFKKSQGAQG